MIVNIADFPFVGITNHFLPKTESGEEKICYVMHLMKYYYRSNHGTYPQVHIKISFQNKVAAEAEMDEIMKLQNQNIRPMVPQMARKLDEKGRETIISDLSDG